MSASLASLAAPAQLSAQEAATTTQEPFTEKVETVAGIEETNIAAQRLAENAERAAIAVLAVSQDTPLNAGVSNVNNLSKLVRLLMVQQSPGSDTNYYLRGVGSFASDEAFSVRAFVSNVENNTLLAVAGLRPILNVAYNVLRPPRNNGVQLTTLF